MFGSRFRMETGGRAGEWEDGVFLRRLLRGGGADPVTGCHSHLMVPAAVISVG